jgi:hypothetical protein
MTLAASRPGMSIASPSLHGASVHLCLHLAGNKHAIEAYLHERADN